MLQKVTKKNLGFANAGDITRDVNKVVIPALAVDDKVCVGCFVQLKDTPKADSVIEVVGASGVAITKDIFGVVVKSELIPSLGDTPVHLIPKGNTIGVLTRGFIAIESESEAKVGQYVYLKTDDGSLVFSDDKALASHSYTGFRVSRGAKTTDGNGLYIVEISTEVF